MKLTFSHLFALPSRPLPLQYYADAFAARKTKSIFFGRNPTTGKIAPVFHNFCKMNNSEDNLPYELAENEELGRYMVATRDIKPFQIILEDESLAFGPSEFNPPCCLICLQEIEVINYVCPWCNLPFCDSKVS